MAVYNKASYTAAAVTEEKELIANFAWETTELLCYKNFASKKFRLDTPQALPLLPETANAIELWYGRLNIRAKIKFHVDQIQVKRSRLRILVQQSCCQIKAMESKIKYIESLKTQQEDQVCILKGVHDQQRAHCWEIMARQQAFKALIEVLDDSEEETNMSSEVKNPATQVSSSTASILVSGADGSY